MECGTGCCSESMGRSFLTREEQIAKLEGYKQWLDSESKGVAEAIGKLKKA